MSGRGPGRAGGTGRHGGFAGAGRSLCAAAGLCLVGPPAGAFEPGDLYLLSSWLPAGQPGICRIDPVSGQVSVMVNLPAAGQGATHMTFTYDAHRDRLLFATNAGLWTVDDAGMVTELDAGFALVPSLVAARGDGILYTYNRFEGFTFVDAADGLHDLLDEGGLARFGFGPNAVLNEMIFDPRTNSLICFQGTFGGVNIPACASTTAPCAVRIPLSPDGTRVAGAVTAAQSDVSTTLELVVGAGLAPNGVVWVADTNTNDQEPRMQLLDTTSMVCGGFASNGPYSGAASTNAGTYSNARDQAVILDTSGDVLRAYGSGESGAGSAFAAAVSGSGAGETARLIEISGSLGATAAPIAGARSVPAAVVAPNPFADGTTVRLDLPGREHVRIAVYDAAGRVVRRLADRELSAGTHQFRWNGLDDDRRAAASGVYFVGMEWDGSRTMRKVVLAR